VKFMWHTHILMCQIETSHWCQQQQLLQLRLRVHACTCVPRWASRPHCPCMTANDGAEAQHHLNQLKTDKLPTLLGVELCVAVFSTAYTTQPTKYQKTDQTLSNTHTNALPYIKRCWPHTLSAHACLRHLLTT
jgi:hypothetical protein